MANIPKNDSCEVDENTPEKLTYLKSLLMLPILLQSVFLK